MSAQAGLIAFALVALGMALTPGPNMAYLISRSLCQGRAAGFVSLAGVGMGFLIYMVLSALGVTALLMAIPLAYDALRLAGALYLGWLAWNALKPGGRSIFQVSDLPPDRPGKLFLMGLLTNLLNPKIAVLYLSLLPQFIDHQGDVLGQTLGLGFVQIVLSVAVNGLVVMTASSVAIFLTGRPAWLRVQRYLMGTVLAGLAVRMAVDSGRR